LMEGGGAPVDANKASSSTPEQSLPVACLLCMSGGCLDAFTWLSLGGVFANSQTGNVVFLGMYSALGQWAKAAHHLPPILAFLVGAAIALRIKAPRLCLFGEILCLTAVYLMEKWMPGPLPIVAIAFGVALQSASFRRVNRWTYLSVTVTSNMLRAVEQALSAPDPDALRAVKTMLSLCLTFLFGAVAGGFATVHLGAKGLIVPILLLTLALALCRAHHADSQLGIRLRKPRPGASD